MTLVPTNKSKGQIKKYEEVWSKIKDLIRSITIKSDNYDEKNIKIKLYSDDELPLTKTMKIPCMVIVVGGIFLENNKYHPQVFVAECLYEL